MPKRSSDRSWTLRRWRGRQVQHVGWAGGPIGRFLARFLEGAQCLASSVYKKRWPCVNTLQRAGVSTLTNLSAATVVNPRIYRVEEGEDDTSTFQIYCPEGAHNPYTRCKTSRMIRGRRMFDIHVYYRNLNIRMDFHMLMQILVKLDLVISCFRFPIITKPV